MINTIFITPRIEMVNTIYRTPRIEIRGYHASRAYGSPFATARFLSCGSYEISPHIFHTHFIYKSHISHQESRLIYLS